VEEVERSAPSVEEAIEAALAELGATEQEVAVQILQEPRSGFLGVGGQEAVVRVRVQARREEASEEDLEEQAEIAADFVEGLLSRMGLVADVEQGVDDGTMYLNVVGGESESQDEEDEDGEDMGLLIGRHGQTLEAVQELTRVVVSHRTGLRCRVIVDVEDYKKRQRARLVSKAREVAKRVAKTGREEVLDPMNPYERKVVHDAVAEVSGVESSSRGEEPDRRVVIRPRG
jgi:spoIIIJ-associated protein